MFSESARQGGTDTTAKLLGAAAKWLEPPGDHPEDLDEALVRRSMIAWEVGSGRSSSPETVG